VDQSAREWPGIKGCSYSLGKVCTCTHVKWQACHLMMPAAGKLTSWVNWPVTSPEQGPTHRADAAILPNGFCSPLMPHPMSWRVKPGLRPAGQLQSCQLDMSHDDSCCHRPVTNQFGPKDIVCHFPRTLCVVECNHAHFVQHRT